MQKLSFSKIKKSLHNFNLKENNRPIIFLVCLIIASILWFVNSLGKEYETTVSMPVNYTNLPKNKVLVNPPPSSFQIRMRANGYTLLRHKFKLTFTPINFNLRTFTNNLMDKVNEADYVILTDKYQKEISQQVSSDVTIIDISPDTLHFHFDYVVERLKPLVADFSMDFESQYFLEDSISFNPKVVTVRGPYSVVDTIKYIKTVARKFKQLNNSTKITISVSEIEGLEIEPRKVEAFIPVSQYTEYSNLVTISKLNVPEGLNLITFPSKIELNCLVSIVDYKNINASNFIVGVDFNKITQNKNTLPLTILKAPDHVKLLKFHPEEVEFIIETK